MGKYRRGRRKRTVWTLLGLVMIIMPGCAMMGPRSISAGRLNYAEAINRTEDEQLLLAVVKGRYGENATLLAVSGVAANMRFRFDAGIDLGVELGPGPADDSLVSGAFAYEENPTITYRPITGEHYVRQLLSPLPLEILVLALRSTTFEDSVLILLVNRINDVRNPDFLDARSAETDSRFMRFVDLYGQLSRADVLQVFRSPRNEKAFDILLHDYTPQYAKAVDDLLALLELPAPDLKGSDIVIPIHFGTALGDTPEIDVSTRSTFDLLEILRAAVVVPEDHAQAGLAVDYPPMGLAGQGLRINSSTSRSNDSSLAVRYRGYWFSISDSDQTTKAAFSMLRIMWAFASTTATDESTIPVMTIPLSR